MNFQWSSNIFCVPTSPGRSSPTSRLVFQRGDNCRMSYTFPIRRFKTILHSYNYPGRLTDWLRCAAGTTGVVVNQKKSIDSPRVSNVDQSPSTGWHFRNDIESRAKVRLGLFIYSRNRSQFELMKLKLQGRQFLTDGAHIRVMGEGTKRSTFGTIFGIAFSFG